MSKAIEFASNFLFFSGWCFISILSTELIFPISIFNNSLPIMGFYPSNIETSLQNVLTKRIEFASHGRIVHFISSNVHVNFILHVFTKFAGRKKMIFNVFIIANVRNQISLKIRIESIVDLTEMRYIKFCILVFWQIFQFYLFWGLVFQLTRGQRKAIHFFKI